MQEPFQRNIISYSQTKVLMGYNLGLHIGQEQKFVVSHTVRQAEMPSLLDRWATDTHHLSKCCAHNNTASLIFS